MSAGLVFAYLFAIAWTAIFVLLAAAVVVDMLFIARDFVLALHDERMSRRD